MSPFRIIPNLLIAFSLSLGSMGAQERLPEYRVKAMYVSLLPQYVYWPKGVVSGDKSFVIGILGASPFDRFLEEALQSNSAFGKPIRVRYSKYVQELLDCQAIFICESDADRLPEVLRAVRGKAILTVGDSPDFALKGVMVNLYLEHKRIGMEINLSVLRSNGLDASSHLLKLAKIVE